MILHLTQHIHGTPAGTETTLLVTQEVFLLQPPGEAGGDQALQELADGGEEGDGPVGGGERGVLPWLGDRDKDGGLPTGREVSGQPAGVENMKKAFLKGGSEVCKKLRREQVRARSLATLQGGGGCCQFLSSEGLGKVRDARSGDSCGDDCSQVLWRLEIDTNFVMVVACQQLSFLVVVQWCLGVTC